MTLEMKQKALDQVPALAMKILGYDGDNTTDCITETVRLITASGWEKERDRFLISEIDMLNHVYRASRYPLEYTVDVSDTCVTIRRDLKDGSHYLVTYTPNR